MKFKIVFYLFLFVCILLFFQLFNTNKVLNYQDDLIQKQNQTNLKLKDSIKVLEEYRATHAYFSLSAQSIEKEDQRETDLFRLENQIVDALRALNSSGGLRKVLPKISNKGTFLIDQIKVVNDQWVLIGFKSDAKWGQAILEFSIAKDNSIQFNELAHFVNPL